VHWVRGTRAVVVHPFQSTDANTMPPPPLRAWRTRLFPPLPAFHSPPTSNPTLPSTHRPTRQPTIVGELMGTLRPIRAMAATHAASMPLGQASRGSIRSGRWCIGSTRPNSVQNRVYWDLISLWAGWNVKNELWCTSGWGNDGKVRKAEGSWVAHCPAVSSFVSECGVPGRQCQFYCSDSQFARSLERGIKICFDFSYVM
jgi:hypothetical protein